MAYCFPSKKAWVLLCVALAGVLGAAQPHLTFTSPAGKPVVVVVEGSTTPLVLHFWATWCPSCVEEFSGLGAAAGRCPTDAVRIIAINVGETADIARDYLAEHSITLESLLDTRGEVWRKISGSGLPVNLIWTGRERRVELGPRSAERWRETLSELGCVGTD